MMNLESFSISSLFSVEGKVSRQSVGETDVLRRLSSREEGQDSEKARLPADHVLIWLLTPP